MLKAARNWLVGVSLCALAAVAGAADTVSWNSLTVPVQFTAGSGSNTAMCVLDFAGTGNDVRYAFLYKWDGVATSFDMLTALDAASENFTVVSQTQSYGERIKSISYNGYTLTDSWLSEDDAPCVGFWWDGYGDYTAYDWVTWDPITVPGENPSGIFSASQLGVSGRTLTDGVSDGWSQDFTNTTTWAIVNTPLYPTSVPEPASIALLSIAAVGLLRRKSKVSKQV